jgi:predicted dehydrogenase
MAHGFQADLVGEKGVVQIVDGGFEFELWTKDESSEFGHLARRHLPMNYPVGNPMLNAIDDLIKEVEQGVPSHSSGTAGRQAFELITAIHLSHREGRRFIKFPLEERTLIIPSN